MKLKYIYYRLKWHLAKFFPLFVHLDLELTNYCNQSCLSCWHNGQPAFKLDFMKKDMAFKLLEDARKLGALSVKLNLRGEPLLYAHLLDVIRKANSKIMKVSKFIDFRKPNFI